MKIQGSGPRICTIRLVTNLLVLVNLFFFFSNTADVFAQSTDDINSSLQFNFSNPGARSLGFGGAFTARADDATAVFANPAGLTQLTTPEISIELRGWQYSNRFLASGTQVSADDFEGLVFDSTDDSEMGLSFVSAIYPSKKKSERWVFGIFRHELANFRTEVHSDGARLVDGGLARPIDGVYNLRIENLGAAVALRLNKNFSVGGTLGVSRFDLASRTERLDNFRSVANDAEPGVIGIDTTLCCQFGNNAFGVITLQTQTTDPGRDDDVVFTLGALWRSPRLNAGRESLISVAAVYRRGAKLGFRGNSLARVATGSTGELFLSYQSQFQDPMDPEGCKEQGRGGCSGIFKVPDILGFGVSVRASESWTLALDFNRVEYSDLLDQTLDIVAADDSIAEGETGPAGDFELEDGDEIRLGVEYAKSMTSTGTALHVRVGAWYDPDHKIRYIGSDVERRAIWAPGDDKIHYAIGLGLGLSRVQFDIGADLSERINTFSLSTVYYFGGG